MEQQQRYLQKLNSCRDLLGEHPEIGRLREDLAPKIRSIRFESHIFYYELDRNVVTVIRILHQSAEPDLFD